MLKLKRFTEGTWFDYPKAEGVRFLIRPLHLSKGLEIRSKIRSAVAVEIPTIKKVGTITSLMEDVDSGVFTWEIFDYILQDFLGIEVDTDEGVVLTRDDIKKVIFDDTDLREFISAKSEWLRENSGKALDVEIKNLQTSQGG